MPSLSVDLNRDRPHDLAAEGDLTTRGPFEIAFRNHGQAVHVHLSMDEALASVANLRENHYYVDGEEEVVVAVDVRPADDPVTGTLTVSTGFGSESESVRVTVGPNPKVTQGVDVDESLSRPQRDPVEEPEDDSLLAVLSRSELVSLLALAVVAVLVALVVGTVVDSALGLVAVAVVLVGLLGAGYIALR